MKYFPFWVNAVDQNGFDITKKRMGRSSPSFQLLHLRDIFQFEDMNDIIDCDTPSDSEDDHCWESILLVNFLIDMKWLLQEVPEILQVRRKLVILSGMKGTATHSLRVETCGSKVCRSFVRKSSSRAAENSILSAIKAGGGLTSSSVTVLEPPLPLPWGTHHTKMALLLNKRGIRIAIFTGNFVSSDWHNKTQGIYVQDFPRSSCSKVERLNFLTFPFAPSTDIAADFKAHLQSYLQCCGLACGDGVFDRSNGSSTVEDDNSALGIFGTSFLNLFDFSSARVRLVSSVPGHYYGEEFSRFGLGRLSAVQELYRRSHLAKQGTERTGKEKSLKRESLLSWQYSSQGSLDDDFLDDLQRAMLGQPFSVRPSQSTFTTRNEKRLCSVRVVYPTEEEVRWSREGWGGGFSLPVSIKNCHPFINARLHRWAAVEKYPSNDFSVLPPRLTSGKLKRFQVKTPDSIDEEQVVQTDVGSSTECLDSLSWVGLTRALPHLKTYGEIVSFENGSVPLLPDCTSGGYLRWFLLTSANLSKAAWGKREMIGRKRSRNMGEVLEDSHNQFPYESGSSTAVTHRLTIRSYEMGVLYTAESAMSVEEVEQAFTCTPQVRRKLVYPTLTDCASFTISNLFPVAVGNEGKDTNNIIFLPYNIINPVPYASSSVLLSQEGGENMKKERGSPLTKKEIISTQDIPWVIDIPHSGVDSLGLSFKEAALVSNGI